MRQLICDNCHEPILPGSVYYTAARVSNGNMNYNDVPNKDFCHVCASKLRIAPAADGYGYGPNDQ